MKKVEVVCDRCKRPVKYARSDVAGYFTHGIRRRNKLEYLVLNYGNPDGYSYSEYKVELCSGCTRKLIDFLYNRKDTQDEK